MTLQIALSNTLKEELQDSLAIVWHNLDLLTIKFYDYFLKTEARDLFKHTKLESQYKMFHASFGEIITHVDNVDALTKIIDSIITKHKKYGINPKHVELFSQSFLKALEDVLGKDYEIYKNLWTTIITELMNYFEKELDLT